MALTKWVPESDPKILRRVGKTGEEAAELSKVCSRITIQGLDAVDPASGRTNREELAREIADVITQCLKSIELFELPLEPIESRVALKTAQMDEWEAMFTEEQQ